jgi:hypothetical protein
MKTKWVIPLLIMSCLLMTARAEEHQTPGAATNNPPSPWGFSVSELLMSKYYGTIFGGTFYPGPMSFTDFIASRKNAAGVMTFDLSIGQKLDRLDTYNHDGGNEYDFTVDQTFRFGSKRYPVLVDAGVCYLILFDLKKIGDDALEEFVRIDLPIRADLPDGPLLQPYAEAFHYHMVGDGLRNEGWWTYGGVFRNQKLGCTAFGKELVLNADFRVGASAGAYGSRAGIEYYRLALTLPFHLNEHWTVTPSVTGQLRASAQQTYVKKNEVFGTLQIVRSF